MKKKTAVYLVGILILGIFLRFYGLGNESFWQDEAHTAFAVREYSTSTIVKNSISHGQIILESRCYAGEFRDTPCYNSELPVYYIFLEIWTGFFGVNEISLRAFSALFGSLALLLIFLISRDVFNEKVALVATLLSSISITLVWYAQEARPGSYLLFLCLLSLFLLMKMVRDGKNIYLIALIAVNALIIYSYLVMVMFIFFEGVIFILDYFRRKEVDKKVACAFLVIFLLCIPLAHRILFTDVNTVHFGRPGVSDIAKFGVELSTWLYPDSSLREKIHLNSYQFSLYEVFLIGSVVLTAALFGILFLYGVSIIVKKDKFNVILWMFFVPLVLSLLVSLLHPILTIFHMRILIYIIPAYLIIVSVGLLNLRMKWEILAVLVIIGILPLMAYYTNVDKQQFRELSEHLPEKETIFVTKDTAKRGVWYYYGQKPNVIGILDLKELKENLNGKNSFWYVFTFMKYSDPEIKPFLEQEYEIIGKKDFFDIELVHYNKKD